MEVNSLGATVEINFEREHHALADVEIRVGIKLIAHLAERYDHVAVGRVWNHVDAVHHLILDETLFDLIRRRPIAVHAGERVLHLHLLLQPIAGRRRRRLHGARRLATIQVLTILRSFVRSRRCLCLLELKCRSRRHRP